MPPQTGQNQVNPNPTPSMGTAMPQVPQEKKPIGQIVGIVIIVLIFILGGLYFWGEKLNRSGPEDILNVADPQVETLQQQGDSDEISAIEKDLTATALDSLDQELEQIEAELNF